MWHGLLAPNVDSATVNGLQMPVVWSPRHRGHAPDGGYWLGVRDAGDEEPERGDVLHDDLVAAGATIVDPPDLGLAPA